MILETILIGGSLLMLANAAKKKSAGNITVITWEGILDKFSDTFDLPTGIGQLIAGQTYSIADQRRDKYGVAYVYIVRPGENFGWVAMDDLIKLNNRGIIKLS